jgi:hypothetical protein
LVITPPAAELLKLIFPFNITIKISISLRFGEYKQLDMFSNSDPGYLSIGYGLDKGKIWILFTTGERDFSVLQKIQTDSRKPSRLLLEGCSALFP